MGMSLIVVSDFESFRDKYNPDNQMQKPMEYAVMTWATGKYKLPIPIISDNRNAMEGLS